MTGEDGSTLRSRSKRQGDAKLTQSVQVARPSSRTSGDAGRRSSRHGRDRRSTGRFMMSPSSSTSSSSGTRLRFLLSILLVSTLLLVLLQTFRHARSGSQNKLRGRMVRARAALLQDSARVGQDTAALSWSDRVSNAIAAAAAPDSVPSSSVVAEQRRQHAEEQAHPQPDWRSYIAAMRQHFDDTVGNVKPSSDEKGSMSDDQNKQMGSSANSGGGGMAVVPGESVRDLRPTPGSALGGEAGKKPAPVPGKSDEEAEQDRKAALEDLDQETLKALFDALYGRGG